jgi:pilus assembly protein CpaD
MMTLTRTLVVAAAFTLAALCLAACQSSARDNPARTAVNPLSLYPLRADPAKDSIALAIHPTGITAAQAEALAALAARRRDVVGGPITLSIPRSAEAGRTLQTARALLMDQGVDPSEILLGAYDAPEAGAPLLASFAYRKAIVASCGKHWDELTHTSDNRVQSNFGCAEVSNMAAQIANPNDIAAPQAEQTPDLQRRLTVLGQYQQGKPTAAEERDQKAGIIARLAP